MPMISDWLRTEERDTNADDAPNGPYQRPKFRPPSRPNEEVRDTALIESINEHNTEAKEAS